MGAPELGPQQHQYQHRQQLLVQSAAIPGSLPRWQRELEPCTRASPGCRLSRSGGRQQVPPDESGQRRVPPELPRQGPDAIDPTGWPLDVRAPGGGDDGEPDGRATAARPGGACRPSTGRPAGHRQAPPPGSRRPGHRPAHRPDSDDPAIARPRPEQPTARPSAGPSTGQPTARPGGPSPTDRAAVRPMSPQPATRPAPTFQPQSRPQVQAESQRGQSSRQTMNAPSPSAGRPAPASGAPAGHATPHAR